MANGYFERGEVYSIRMDGGVGSEEGSFRPGVVVSCDEGNKTCSTVLVAYLTTQYRNLSITMETMATGRRSYILGSQIATVDKGRIRPIAMGKLTPSELNRLDGILEKVFDLGYKDDPALAEKDKEIEELKAKIAELTGEVAREQAKYIGLAAKHDDELLSYKVENTMWQKCYDKVLSQLVDMKCVNDMFVRGHLSAEPKLPEVPDLPRKPVEPEEPVLNVPKEPVAPEEPVKDDRVDINHCTQTQLKKVGMSDGLARAVVAKRPFQSVADLKNVPGMNGKKFQIFEPKVCCTPLEIIVLDKEPEVAEVVEVAEVPEVTEGKLNINAVSGRDLIDMLGMSSSTAYAITGFRRKNGPYAKLEDMANAPKITMHIVDRYRDKIYCGPGIEEKQIVRDPKKVEEPTEPYTGPKVNINTASAVEIHNITGMEMTVCYSITGCRKRDGLYKAVEDLRNIPRFTDYHWSKFGQMFEV